MAEPARTPTEQDRLAEMHAFLDAHADEIRRWAFGNLVFDWSPLDVKYRLTEAGKIGKGQDRLSA